MNRTTLAREVELFERQGYVILEGLLDQETDLQPVLGEYSTVLDRLAGGWLTEGKIASYDPQQPVLDRMLQVMRETQGACHQHFDISLPLDAIREDTPMHLGPAVFGLMRNPRLLDAVQAFIGPEIYSNPIQHVRVKPPEGYISEDSRNVLTAKTFWHQDLGVIAEDADDSNILNVFLPITETTEENGCVLVVPGSHRQGLVHHCRSANSNGIPEALVGTPRIPVILKPGDVLFMNKLTMHASLPNVSNGVRWSFDLRYVPTGQPTGRPWFPGFVARSRANPESELTSYGEWADSWRRARATLANRELPRFARWGPHLVCPFCAEPSAREQTMAAAVN